MDKKCKSLKTIEDRKICYTFGSDLQHIIADLDEKGYIRSELKTKQGEEKRKKIMDVLTNVSKITNAFNNFFDMYVDRIKPDSKNRLKNFLELNKPYGMTEEDLIYLLCSEMIFVFLQNIEEFRSVLLFIMKLDKDERINKKTTLGKLIRTLTDLGINKSEALNEVDYELRNGLSHGLFWLEKKGISPNRKLYLNYATDITFDSIKPISLKELETTARHQAIYTQCLVWLVTDWFS